MEVGSPYAGNKDGLPRLDDVAGRGAGNGGEAEARLLQVDVVAADVRHGRCDRPDPSGVSVDDARPDCGTFVETELLRCLGRQTLAYGLSGCQDHARLARLTAEGVE